jgi:hypothetical protein
MMRSAPYGIGQSHSAEGARYGRITLALLAIAVLAMVGCSRCNGERKPTADQDTANQVESARQDATAHDPAVLALLRANSKECIQCAEKNCNDKMDLCQQITGNAAAGAAVGQSRRKLCLDTLECAIKSRCVSKISAMPCYCGSFNIDECLAGKSNGACKRAIEKGHESADPGTIAEDWYDEKTGGSSAMGLVMCLVNRNCEMCF